MLPGLHKLSLRAAPVGEFVYLSQAEADALNQGGGEPIMGDEYMAHGCTPEDVDEDGDAQCFPTFRVWGRNPCTGRKDFGPALSRVYNADLLWAHLVRQANDGVNFTDPSTNVPFWREDWYALHERYDPGGRVPSQVKTLPRKCINSRGANDEPYPDTASEAGSEAGSEAESEAGSEAESRFDEEGLDRDRFDSEDPSQDLQRAVVHARGIAWAHLTPSRYGDPNRQAYHALAHSVAACIARGDARSGSEAYRDGMIRAITESAEVFESLRLLLLATSVPHAARGQLLRLLAAYADARAVRATLRRMDALQPGGGASSDAAGALSGAIRRYIGHLQGPLPPPGEADSDESAFERHAKASRLIDARRVLHHLTWDAPVRDEWLSEYNGRNVVEAASDDFRFFSSEAGARLNQRSDEVVSWLEGRLAATRTTYYEVTEPDLYAEADGHLQVLLDLFTRWHARWSGADSDDYGALLGDDGGDGGGDGWRPFPFGGKVVRLWAVANYMHRLLRNRHDQEPPQGAYEIERDERYQRLTERVTRLVWLGVTWWVGHPYPLDGRSADEEQMQHFFWAYVAPLYSDERDAEEMFALDWEVDPPESVLEANDAMRDQWIGDRRSGPWWETLGMTPAEHEAAFGTGTATPPARARDGGETPNPRRQRRD